MKDLFRGIGAVMSGFGSVGSMGAHVYLIIIGVCALFFMGGSWASYILGDWVIDLIGGSGAADAAADGTDGSWLGWLKSAAGGVGHFLVSAVSLYLVGIVGGALVLVLLSPLLSHVSDKAWARAGMPEPHDSMCDIMRSIARGIGVALRCFALQMLCTLVLLLLGLLPLIGIFVTIGALCVSSFFYGQTFVDYAAERAEQNGLTEGKRGGFPFRHVALTIGIGLPFAIVVLIPYIGRYLALFLAPASTAAGAKLVAEHYGGKR